MTALPGLGGFAADDSGCAVSVDDALRERAEAAIAAALRVAALTPEAGNSRLQVRRHLRLTEQELSDALEWIRDAMTAGGPRELRWP
jgi:hypothetical protein